MEYVINGTMNKKGTIATTLGLSIVLFVIATFFLPLQYLLGVPTYRFEGIPNPSNKALPTTNPAGSNMTTGSNMTGPARNTTGGAHGSSIHTTNPAGSAKKGGKNRTTSHEMM